MNSPTSRKLSAVYKLSTVCKLILLSLLLLSITSCEHSQMDRSATGTRQGVDTQVAQNSVDANPARKADARGYVQFDKISLAESEHTEDTVAAIDRKIIRNADLTMEVPSTTDAQQKIVSIAESHGGFIVTSEAKQKDSQEPAQRTLDIKLVLRVPENQFGAALDQIRGLAKNVTEDKITGQDVTEEFIDLEARIKTQKALEVQFLEIMKQARKVEDALEVQRQIAEVRSDIERLEGRKRFLENRSALSTITISMSTPKPMVVVPTTGFRHSVSDALAEGIDVGSAILLFFVRFAIVMIPVGVLVLLPSGLVVRYVIRRMKRMRLAEALSATPSH
jgi:uncharacterized protein DUF4349